MSNDMSNTTSTNNPSDKNTIDCEEALKRLFEYIDHELHGRRHEEMEDHMSKCRSCYSRLEFEKRLQQHLKNATEQKAPQELQNKIKKLIHKL
ncbi:MAG: zf-HC2 domain-containing protein [Gammaproteobacteria bacterium]|nr:zf-HC2 domain-containing protein [Gammaproteobacteria bacterium]